MTCILNCCAFKPVFATCIAAVDIVTRPFELLLVLKSKDRAKTQLAWKTHKFSPSFINFFSLFNEFYIDFELPLHIHI